MNNTHYCCLDTDTFENLQCEEMEMMYNAKHNTGLQTKTIIFYLKKTKQK